MHMQNYPARYGDGPPFESENFGELIGNLVSGKMKVLLFAFTREEVEAADISGVVGPDAGQAFDDHADD